MWATNCAEWIYRIAENENGRSDFLEYRDEDQHLPIEKVGADLRARMTWLGAKTAPGMEVAADAQREAAR